MVEQLVHPDIPDIDGQERKYHKTHFLYSDLPEDGVWSWVGRKVTVFLVFRQGSMDTGWHGFIVVYFLICQYLPHNRKKQFGPCANVTWPHSPCFIYHSIQHVLKVVLFLRLFVLILKSRESQRKNWGKCNGHPTVTKSFSEWAEKPKETHFGMRTCTELGWGEVKVSWRASSFPMNCRGWRLTSRNQ